MTRLELPFEIRLILTCFSWLPKKIVVVRLAVLMNVLSGWHGPWAPQPCSATCFLYIANKAPLPPFPFSAFLSGPAYGSSKFSTTFCSLSVDQHRYPRSPQLSRVQYAVAMSPNSCQSLSLNKNKAEIIRLLKSGVNRKDAHRQLFVKCGCNCAEPSVDLALFNAAIRKWRREDPAEEWRSIPMRNCYPNHCTSTHIDCHGRAYQEYAALHPNICDTVPSMNANLPIGNSNYPPMAGEYGLSGPGVQGTPQTTFNSSSSLYNGCENLSSSILDGKTTTQDLLYGPSLDNSQPLPHLWEAPYAKNLSTSAPYSQDMGVIDLYQNNPTPYIIAREPYGTRNTMLGVPELGGTMSPNQGLRVPPMADPYLFGPEPSTPAAHEAIFDGKGQNPGNGYGFDDMDENK